MRERLQAPDKLEEYRDFTELDWQGGVGDLAALQQAKQRLEATDISAQAAHIERLSGWRSEAMGERALTVEPCDGREHDMRAWLQERIDADDKKLARRGEKIVRAMAECNEAFKPDTQEVDASVAAGGVARPRGPTTRTTPRPNSCRSGTSSNASVAARARLQAAQPGHRGTPRPARRAGVRAVWTTPGELRAQVLRRWEQGALPAESVAPSGLFALRLALRAPASNELSERFDEARPWAASLQEGRSDAGLHSRCAYAEKKSIVPLSARAPRLQRQTARAPRLDPEAVHHGGPRHRDSFHQDAPSHPSLLYSRWHGARARLARQRPVLGPGGGMTTLPAGTVAFVSAGPGSADLITLRGARLLAQADTVLFDALTDAALRELAPQAQWIDVGKRGDCHSTQQSRIDALLVRHARAGERVVRLKGGDASVFGRLEEELQALARAGVHCQVVPGITAAAAAAAAMHRPLTRRGTGRSVSLTTAVAAQPDGTPRLRDSRSADTEVFYMAGRRLGALQRQLLQAGWPADTPVCVVSRAGCADQIGSDHRLSDLSSASVLHAGRPTVVTLGAGARAIVGSPVPMLRHDLARTSAARHAASHMYRCRD